MPPFEKRQIQRIHFEYPLNGTIGSTNVAVLDVSTTGARIEHTTRLSTEKAVDLTFTWDGQTVTINCDVVRSRLQRSSQTWGGVLVYHSGLRLTDPSSPGSKAVRGLIASHLSLEMRRKKMARLNHAG